MAIDSPRPSSLFEPHRFSAAVEGVIGGNCRYCSYPATAVWHQVRNFVQPPKGDMTPDEISAVAVTLELLRKKPPKDESWNRPGERTLAQSLQSWLKEQL